MYTESLFREHLLISRNLGKSVNDVASRWVQAMLKPYNYGYTGWGHLDSTGDWIIFQYKHYDGIQIPTVNMPELKFSSKYLIDDSNLEQDALAWYKEYESERLKKLQYEKDLKNDPKVKEYLKLTNQNPFFF